MYTKFYITEQQIKRRIWVYLPGNYAFSEIRYPVLYMQDGQNLFDVKESFSEEWGIDEFLDSVNFAGIVIGIDNGGETRILEYNPNDSETYGKGKGREYLEVLINILKPYVDNHFRTLPDRKNTAIAGSSMGGLISFYAGLYYPKVFGSIGVFSPSFWLVPELEAQIRNTKAKGHSRQRYYFYAGGMERDDLIEKLEGVQKLMKKKFRCKTELQVNKKGTHSERYWRQMFPGFYEWLNPFGLIINKDSASSGRIVGS
jgi:predicted alpha/beta superfamily hydrolase